MDKDFFKTIAAMEVKVDDMTKDDAEKQIGFLLERLGELLAKTDGVRDGLVQVQRYDLEILTRDGRFVAVDRFEKAK